MLPESLSNHYFSLCAGEWRNVFSYCFQLYVTGETKFLGISPQILQVQNNLMYEEANQQIENANDFWGILYECCQGMLKKRLENGALNLEHKEFKIDISNPEQIQISPVNRNDPANLIIQELAILVNHESAHWFTEKKVPAIYRTQIPYQMIKTVEVGQPLTIEHVSIEAAHLSISPSAHSGLGCEEYLQITSPIRRFVDLINQLQMQTTLQTVESWFTPEELMAWAEQIEVRQKLYKRAEREIERYWKLRYLSQQQDERFPAIVKRHFGQCTEIEITSIGFQFPLSGLSTLELGTEITIQLEQVDAELGQILGKQVVV